MLIGRFFYLQIIKGPELRDQREQNINASELIYPKRGRIISKDGTVLAEDIKTFSIVVDLEQKPDYESMYLLSEIFSEDLLFDDIEKKVLSSLRFSFQETLLTNLSQEDLSKFLVRSSDLSGFSIKEDYKRNYDYHPSIFHILGHLGFINELDSKYFSERIPDYDENIWQKVGKSGLERVYEYKLRGTHGKRYFQRNARGNRKQITGVDNFKEGEELITSIRYSAQKLAFDLLDGKQGAVVAIDLSDFSIPVAVSVPSISANDLSGISSKNYAELLNDVQRPLFNRAFMGLYPPGSTVKPLLTIFSLSEGYTNWTETILDDGFFRFEEEQRVFNAWKEGGHGLTDLEKALVESSNPFFMNLATKFDKAKFVKFMQSASFGSLLCTDCYPHQYSPLINDSWKQKNFGKDLYKGDFINLGVGQGYMLTTPLHLALLTSAIAKKGKYQIPYIVNGSNQQELFLENNLTDYDWEKLHESLINVVYSPNGTGFRINAGNLKMAGKSGTSQIIDIKSKEEYDEVRQNPLLRDHAIFIGFAPYDDPQFAIAVIIENGESGGSVAGPIAKEVLELLIDAN
ncbi:MAG: penicillin-binding transpeptidase domain-containing protein [Proteobacteria bacterium]|nr:penicillin-binding transpeptidase domain-containing protein [Pseudomonadota bacterium]